MYTYLIDARNNVLHPTKRSDMVRKWLKRGQAKVIAGGLTKNDPLIVQVFKTFTRPTVDVEFRIGIDPGSKNVGHYVYKIYKNKIVHLIKGEDELRTHEITKLLSERKMYRNSRRHCRRKNAKRKYGQVKFRHPRWKNRKKHSFQPTHRHLIDSHISIIEKLLKYIPVAQTKIIIEYAKFDSHRLHNPTVRGNQYQKGIMYGYENSKAYSRARDKYVCQICKTFNLIGCAHHIIPVSLGGSDRPDNIIYLCTKCHNDVHHSKKKCPAAGANSVPMSDSGVLNSCMVELLSRLKKKYRSVDITYGYITAAVRNMYSIPKSHEDDASIIALCDSSGLEDIALTADHDMSHLVTINYKQYRRHIRNWTQRLEDRKYLLNGKTVAWNRRRRCEQDKKKPSLEEFRKKNPTVNVIVKPGRRIFRKSNTKILFKPGDLIKAGTETDTVKGWGSTHSIVIGEVFGDIPKRYCKVIHRSAGLCRIF